MMMMVVVTVVIIIIIMIVITTTTIIIVTATSDSHPFSELLRGLLKRQYNLVCYLALPKLEHTLDCMILVETDCWVPPQIF